MSSLLLVPVDDDWLSEFERTVKQTISVPNSAAPEIQRDLDEVRIWGTTAEEKKRPYFRKMVAGDPILFYNSGKYFAIGRLGDKFKSEELGEHIWDNPESSFVFTLTEIHAVEIDIEPVNEILGYKSGNIPMGFNRPSDKAISSLLQKYNSVEEAYQDLKKIGGIEGKKNADDTSVSDPTVREHTEIQAELIQLGIDHGYDVYVAKNDQGREYKGQKFSDLCVDGLNLTGFSDAAMNIIEYVDVIWLEDDYIVEMFEVESTTSVFSGILRMTDFVVKVPNLEVSMNIVAPDSDEEKVRKQISRPTFQKILGQIKTSSLKFISFEEVRERKEVVNENGPLQKPF